ncbi:MAG: hypothetical protein IIU33_02810, partial [Bacteroidales bacterium]|nr:hypothetical protein [Bacteroidales bacterium]
MRRFIILGCLVLGMSIASVAQTVTAASEEIADDFDLKAAASLFGESKDIEDFENKLNDESIGISNLDLNGDGDIDYLRCVETVENGDHYIVIQAVLAKDIYQDIATIYVKKDVETKNITVQVIGNEYIYGRNYIVEPVYIYRPVIYNWFWDPYWHYWHSPYYWGYYPHYWHCWHHRPYHVYHHHIVEYHHHHHHCSYHHPHNPHSGYNGHREVHNGYGNSHPNGSFNERHPEHNNISDHHRTIRNDNPGFNGSSEHKAPANNASRVANDNASRTPANNNGASRVANDNASRTPANNNGASRVANDNASRTPANINN